jgi:hypothetical protein
MFYASAPGVPVAAIWATPTPSCPAGAAQELASDPFLSKNHLSHEGAPMRYIGVRDVKELRDQAMAKF